MKLRSLEKAGKLPQTNATWQATVRLAPTWVAPKDRARYRPHLVFMLDTESGAIRLLIMEEQRPAPEALLSLFANAISKPMMGAGGRYRPARIVIDDRELAQALAPQLAEIGVACDYAATLPALETVLRELSAHLNQGEERPGLSEVPGITLPLLAEFYAAAAYFYQQAPWRWVDNLAAIEVRYPAAGRAVYAAIMGFGGQEFGLAVFPTAKISASNTRIWSRTISCKKCQPRASPTVNPTRCCSMIWTRSRSTVGRSPDRTPTRW